MTPTINELVVYTPAEDFEVSKRFYAALGFTLTEGWGDTMDCELGGAKFRLQNYYVKDWAENFMMKFDVDDVQAWHDHAKKVIDDGDFAHARYDEPEMIGNTKIFHVWDPCERRTSQCRQLFVWFVKSSIPGDTVQILKESKIKIKSVVLQFFLVDASTLKKNSLQIVRRIHGVVVERRFVPALL